MGAIVRPASIQVATDRGDYEAAIGAPERVLFYHPNLARVKYEFDGSRPVAERSEEVST